MLRSLVLVLSILLIPWALDAAWIDMGGTPDSPVQVTVLEDGPTGTVLEFDIAGFYLEDITVNGKKAVRVILPNAVTFLEEGLPELPRVTRSIIIPDEAGMSYEVMEARYTSYDVPDVIPSRGNLPRTVDPADVPFRFGDFYRADSWFPEETFVLHDPFILRDFRGVSCQFNPFQYNPVQGTLKVCDRLVVRVFEDHAGVVNLKRRSGNGISADFVDLYDNMFLNYTSSGTRNNLYISETGKMLIIVDDAFMDYVTPLYEWKMKKGIETTVVPLSEIGGTRSQLQNYLQNCYDNDGVTYVLLVGDGDDVPYQVGNTGSASGAVADPVYANLEGADWYPDCYVSRFSANSSSQVENMVARSIGYERYPSIGADWYHKGTGVASAEGTPPDYQRANWLRTDLLGYNYTQIDQIYDPGASVTTLINAINQGRSYINYIGHGWNQGWVTTGFDNWDAQNLDNYWMLPIVCSVACDGGYFPGTTCFGEAWTRAGSATNPAGAIAFYGSSISQSWVPPTVAQAAAVDYLVQDQANTVGGLLFNGSCVMIEEYYPGNDGAEMFQTWHIFGDASVQLRTDTPYEIEVAHPGAVSPGGSLTVTVSSSSVPLEGALVCLWKVDQLHLAGYTDSSGEISFAIPLNVTAGEMDVTVTSYNGIPYEGICDLDVNIPPKHREARRL